MVSFDVLGMVYLLVPVGLADRVTLSLRGTVFDIRLQKMS